jgi:hypothetical protein
MNPFPLADPGYLPLWVRVLGRRIHSVGDCPIGESHHGASERARKST